MERLDVIFARMQITSLILQVAIIYACTKGSEDVFYAYLPLLLTDKLKFLARARTRIHLRQALDSCRFQLVKA